MKKVAVVTGGNRGMGFETCKQLLNKGFEIVLTAKNSKEGKIAIKKLDKADVVFFQTRCYKPN